MNWLDVTIIVIMLSLAIVGLRNGLIRSLSTAVGIVAGIVVARRYYEVFFEDLLPIVNNETGAKMVVFVLIFLAVLIITSFVGSGLRKVVSVLFLGWLDTAIGGILGLAVAASILGVALSLLGASDAFGISGPIKDSTLAPFLMARMPLIIDLLPEEFDIRGLLPPN